MRRLIVQCGVAETRGCLFVEDEARRFFFAPARGDEGDNQLPQAGDVHIGRIRKMAPSMDGAFVDLGGPPDAFLRLKKSDRRVHEGERLLLRIRRAGIGQKGPVAALDWREAAPAAGHEAIEAQFLENPRPRRLNTPKDAALQIVEKLDDAVDDVVVDDVSASQIMSSHFSRMTVVSVDDAACRVAGLDGWIDDALSPSVALPDGGRMIFQETAAGCMVDFDLGAIAAKNRALAAAEFCARASEAAFKELDRRAIAGRIIMDFPALSDRRARTRLEDRLNALARARKGWSPGALRRDGLFDLTAPRRERSLLDLVSEPIVAQDAVRAGRRFRLEWRCRQAMRALQDALAGAPTARIELRLGAELHAALADRQQWLARLAQQYGARYKLACKATLEARAYDLVG